MTKPKRIQRKRTKGWRMPEGAVSVTRPGKYGNPFKTAEKFREAIELVALLDAQPESMDRGIYNRIMQIVIDIEDLRGKDLACWCKPGKACHADVLIELANY